MEVLQIKDWDTHFENAKSRSIENRAWCPFPNKQDGLGYSRLLSLPDGAAIYGAFVAIVLIASKQTRPRRGYLTDTGRLDGYPYSISDLSLMSKMPEKVLAKAIPVLTSEKIGWIEKIKLENGENSSLGDMPGIPDEHAGDTGYPSSIHMKEGKEGEEGEEINIKEKYIKEIIDYLNKVTGKKFKNNTKSTVEHISARINEGYSIDDFKSVIDFKNIQWGKDAKMSEYLRPQTLFSANFESYLQAADSAKAKAGEENTQGQKRSSAL